MRQLEKKICEAGPEDKRPDPFVLGEAIDELVEEEEIGEERLEEGRLPVFYTAGDFDGTRGSDKRRREYILGLYREYHGLMDSGLVGKALERVVYSAAERVAAGRFTILGSPDGPVKTGTVISGKTVEREPDLIFIGCGGTGNVVDVEVKNLREWLSASSEEVWSLIGRALRIDAVPVLITRKVLGPSFYIFRRIGLLAWQVHFQFFPPEMERRVAKIRHKDGLGFADVRCTHEPTPSLVRYIGEHLPRLVPAAKEIFLGHKDMLSRYAITERLEKEIRHKRRSRVFREFQSEVLSDVDDEADDFEYNDFEYDFY